MILLKNLPIFFFLFASSCFAQKDSLNLVLEYLPNKTYTRHSESHIIIEIWENRKIINTSQSKSKGKFIITTGALSNNSFPFSIKLETDETTYFNNLEFKGICSPLEHPKISIVVPTIENKEQEKFLLSFIQETIKQTPVLSKKLKLGDSFTTSTPIKYSLEQNLALDMSILTRYTLTSLDKDYAYFSYEGKFYIKDKDYAELKYSGGGTAKGKLIYDIKNHFFTSPNNNESSLNIKISKEEKEMILKLKMNINDQIVL